MSRIFSTSFSAVYPLYVAKAQRKGRTQAEVDDVILGKLVDELSRGKAMQKVLRSA